MRLFTSIISNLFGKFASFKFPSKLQHLINYSYCKLFNIDLSEFKDYKSYGSLNELFTRELIKERRVDSLKDSVISPCDALITILGEIDFYQAYQIKNMRYSVYNLVGNEYRDVLRYFEGGVFCNFYLSPKDYHRFHIPFDLKVISINYIKGALFPVNMPFLKRKKELFVENERVVIEVEDNYLHRHFLVLVGALNVGKIRLVFDYKEGYFRYTHPLQFKKGDLLGWFEMGSTIVILSQKDSIKYEINIGDRVKFGEKIGYLIGDGSDS